VFKENFEKFQKEMEELDAGADKPEAQAAGEEAAEALQKLSTSDGNGGDEAPKDE